MNGFPLNLARKCRKYLVHKVCGNPDMQVHLASLGFVPGAELTIIRRSLAGSVIVSIKDGRLALGRNMAECLWVR